jgi:hypothetical protein
VLDDLEAESYVYIASHSFALFLNRHLNITENASVGQVGIPNALRGDVTKLGP